MRSEEQCVPVILHFLQYELQRGLYPWERPFQLAYNLFFFLQGEGVWGRDVNSSPHEQKKFMLEKSN